MLFPIGASPADLAAASPIDLLHKDFPPPVVFHATADKLFDVRSSVALHQRLTRHLDRPARGPLLLSARALQRSPVAAAGQGSVGQATANLGDVRCGGVFESGL